MSPLRLFVVLPPLLLAIGPADATPAAACRWREPPRTYPAGVWWSCAAIG